MKTAVIYARYSSDNQTEQSIKGQLRVCQEYAQRNDILILDTYIDRAMTGTNDNRPDFQKMIKDSADKNWQHIIVYKLDRFSRNKYETAKYKKILKDNGVKLLSAMENIPDTPEGIILESLLEGMAEYYSAELSQKVRRGMNESRLKGNYTGGFLIYGYKVENHKVLINSHQAEVVRFIYDQYALGTYVKDIISHLTKNQIFNRGKPFARNTIYNILKNEKYSGIYRYKNQVFDNIYPQIVPTEIYNKVRKKIELNKYGKRSTEVIYLLKNKLVCGQCGMPITADTGTSKTGKKNRYYKCNGRKQHNGCNLSATRKDEFENFVIESILSVLKKPKSLNQMLDVLLELQTNSSQNNKLLKSLENELKEKEIALNNLLKAVEQGVINKTTNQRMNELENQIEELNMKIMIEKNQNSITLTRQELREYYLEALILELKLLIDYLVKQIKVFENKIEITFNSPIKTSPDDNQGFFICSFFSRLAKFCTAKLNCNSLIRKSKFMFKWLFIPCCALTSLKWRFSWLLRQRRKHSSFLFALALILLPFSASCQAPFTA